MEGDVMEESPEAACNKLKFDTLLAAWSMGPDQAHERAGSIMCAMKRASNAQHRSQTAPC